MDGNVVKFPADDVAKLPVTYPFLKFGTDRITFSFVVDRYNKA